MPLIHSPSNKAREENIKEMIHSGHPVKQAVAAAYHEQRSAADEREDHERHKYGRHSPY